MFWSDAEMKHGYEHGMIIMDLDDSCASCDLDAIVLVLARYNTHGTNDQTINRLSNPD